MGSDGTYGEGRWRDNTVYGVSCSWIKIRRSKKIWLKEPHEIAAKVSNLGFAGSHEFL